MKRKSVILFFTVVVFAVVFVKEANAQALTWQKWYDYENLEDNAEDIVQTSDGGYAFISVNYVPLNNSTVLSKIDKFGNLQWQELYNASNIGGELVTGRTLSITSDNCFIISGNTRDSALIFKTDSLGKLEWVKKYTKQNYYSIFTNHHNTNDGGIITSGRIFNPGRGYIIKLDSLGNKVWDAVFTYVHTIYRVVQGNEDDYYLIGFDTSTVLSENWLIKTNNWGNEAWRISLDYPNPSSLLKFQKHIYVSGGLDSLILTKVETTGKKVFENSYYKGNHGCADMCLSKTDDLLLAGVVNYMNNISIAVSKVKTNGDLIFNKVIPSLGFSSYAFLPYSVKSTFDGGFVFAGFTNYPPNFFESNIFVAKADSLCNAPLIVGINNDNTHIPSEFEFFQNYPNPFNSSTIFKYNIMKAGFITLEIYDLLGKKINLIVKEYKNEGSYSIMFAAKNFNLPSGIYYCKLIYNQKKEVTKKIVIIK